jgi:hypothetical protein
MTLIASFGLCLVAQARSDFRNLGFDEAPTTSGPLQAADTLTYLPGWTLKYGGQAQSFIDVDTIGNVGNNGYAILNSIHNTLGLPVEGRYSLLLDNGFFNGQAVTWEISQTGTVPTDARSIQFKNFEGFLSPTLRIGGTDISPILLGHQIGSGNLRFDIYGADVTPYAGQTVELVFYTRPGAYKDFYGFDSISVSSTVIPEPSTGYLLMLGLLGFVCTPLIRRSLKAC